MKEAFLMLHATRKHYVNYLKHYSLDELNVVPNGFKNSLFWNAAHALTTQQLLCYYLSKQPLYIPTEWVTRFKKGTVAEDASKEDLIFLKKNLISSARQMEDDYMDDIFIEYTPYETSYGYTIERIEDAIAFNNVHESLHLGYMMALRKHI